MFPMAAGLKIPFRPLGKIELKDIPILGFIFSITLVFVDRSDAESRKKSLIEMRKVLDKKISVVIFPEGTRNRTGKPLKSFYDGAFRLAIETQTPILPMVYCNCLHMWNNEQFLIHPVDLKAIYLPPVDTKNMTEADIPMLKEKIYNMMEAVILKEDLRFA
jgi:1-acyl-sn-glycerol-3-phosphate acyltransferase